MDPLDRERFSAIGHTGLAFWNPVAPDLVDRWIAELPLSTSSRVLDIGCGRAELLLRIVERFGCRAIGVDRAASSIEAARTAARERCGDGLIDLRCEAFQAREFTTASFDLAICIGSTQAIADLEAALGVLAKLVVPGGLLLVGEGYWRQDPAPGYLDHLGCDADALHTHAGNQLLAERHGFEVLATHAATDAEWGRYEDTYADNIQKHLEEAPDDPAAAAMAERIRSWREAYLAWGRDTLGFGLYLLRTPAPA